MIYAQSRMLYEIIPNALCSSFDPKIKPRPHADGIVGCTSTKPVDPVVKQVSQLSIKLIRFGTSHDFVSTHPNDECNFCAIVGPKGKPLARKE